MWLARQSLAMLLAVSFLSGCVFYPKKIEYDDPECNIRTKRMELAVLELNGGSGCGSSSGDVEVCLAVYLGTAAASAIVSGSLVIIGNSIFWLERQGKCLNKPVAQASQR